MIQRKGDWIQTHNGVSFYPLDPQIEDIQIEDIAHSLSMQCRFNGHITDFYSVAEHCVHASFCVEEDKLEALLHDASEAYICDIPRPIKPMLSEYKEIEKNIERKIAEKFRLQYPWSDEIKSTDNYMLFLEAHELMNYTPKNWTFGHYERPANKIELQCWTPQVAKQKFLKRFDQLYREN